MERERIKIETVREGEILLVGFKKGFNDAIGVLQNLEPKALQNAIENVRDKFDKVDK